MEIDLSLFAQRIAMIAILAHGAVVAISDRLRARASTLQRVSQARIRQQAILRAMPRG
jgi:uncharacterized membrane protein affecting hemolysin expression